ncbi:macrophage mannose receptor 1-like [Entelurus aequoreus]|uniref:macrophage mannose receptor 1-like n=1 Tax=Entelurus aequoreus TaxID=161455 RepID=UPI002B1CE435|nr:macrophage mannose receptor 1-like [Entelurus aequoreus]
MDRENFAEAQEKCSAFDASLVSFHNDPEYQRVLEVIRENEEEDFIGPWIGLNDIIQEGTFVWYDPPQPDTPYDPNAFADFAVTGNTQLNNCVYIGNDGMGHAGDCSVQRPFICA